MTTLTLLAAAAVLSVVLTLGLLWRGGKRSPSAYWQLVDPEEGNVLGDFPDSAAAVDYARRVLPPTALTVVRIRRHEPTAGRVRRLRWHESGEVVE